MTLNEACDKAIQLVNENLQECCEEMLEWHDTAILREGKIREIGEICKELSDYGYLRIVESYIFTAALRKIAEIQK